MAGRRRLAGEAADGSPGAAFATTIGAKGGIAFVYRQLSVDAGLAARAAELRVAAEHHASGYTLVSWLGTTPEEHLADCARLSSAMADAPTDAGVQPEIWGVDRIRSYERTMIEGGRQPYTVVARHDETGSLAAITQITVDAADPGWASQAITAVLPEHRGHRLGLLVKVEMLDLLTRQVPEVRCIVTRNAGANEHMVAINEQLGFKISSVRRDWELTLAAG